MEDEVPVGIAELYWRHAKPLRRYVMTLVHDWDVACDIVQQTYLKALEQEGIKHPRAWLHRVAHNSAVDYLRDWTNHAYALEGSDPPQPSEPDEPDPADLSLYLPVLREALGGLPDHYRVVVEMHYLQDLAYQEIGERLGISMRNAKIRAYRARRLLEQAIGTGTTGCPASSDGSLPHSRKRRN